MEIFTYDVMTKNVGSQQKTSAFRKLIEVNKSGLEKENNLDKISFVSDSILR